jgi:hypothetical protein
MVTPQLKSKSLVLKSKSLELKSKSLGFIWPKRASQYRGDKSHLAN